MSTRSVRQRLEDMLDAIVRIRRYTEGMEYPAFAADPKTMDAVARNLELIGEASKRIPPSLHRLYTEARWERIADMRNKLVHDYADTDTRLVWQTIQARLGPLETSLRAMMDVIRASDNTAGSDRA